MTEFPPPPNKTMNYYTKSFNSIKKWWNELHCVVCQSCGEAKKVGVNYLTPGRETATTALILSTEYGSYFLQYWWKAIKHRCESMLLVLCILRRKYKGEVGGVFSLELLFTSPCDWAAVRRRVCAQWFPVSDRRGQTQPRGPSRAAHQWGQCKAEHWAFTHLSSADRRRKSRHPARHEVNLLCKTVFSCRSRLPGALAWVGTYFHDCVGGVRLVKPLVL